MGLRTILKTAGHWLKGSILKVDSEIQFDATSNPEIDSTGGNFVWNTQTSNANSWKLRDPGTTEEILITDTLAKTFTLHPNYTASGFGGVFTPTINGVNVVEIAQESDFGTAVGSVITLAANTTYFIRGNVNCSNRLLINGDNIAILGWDRDKDGLTYTSSGGDFITVDNVNCEFSNLKFSSTNVTGGEVVLRADNHNYGVGFNDGRDKVLTIVNCQFRNCYDVWHIEGFDLVDIQNTLVWYVQATVMGCHFQNNSKLQLSSCEFVRWFDETSIPTPSGWALTPLIELRPNGAGNGFGAVNISGCLFHPQQTQEGIKIDNTATIGFGTISANTVINVGLTTGVATNIDYDIQNTTIIQANQGIGNGNAKATLSIVGNLNDLDTGTTNPQVLAAANVTTGAFTNTPTFPLVTRVITSAANCSLTYDSKVDANFMVVVTATVEMSGDGFIACRLRSNGTAIPYAIGYPEIRQGRAQSFTFSVIGQATFGDVFDVEFESFNTGGTSTPKDILVREFVLNGYQF